MTTGMIIATAVASVVAVYCILLAVKFAKEYKKLFLASAGVYFSGTVFILLVSIFNRDIPLSFIIIAECSILSVYLITFITTKVIIKNIDAIRADVKAGKIKAVPDEEEDPDEEENI